VNSGNLPNYTEYTVFEGLEIKMLQIDDLVAQKERMSPSYRIESNLFITWSKVQTLLLSLAFSDFYKNKNGHLIFSQQRSIPAEKNGHLILSQQCNIRVGKNCGWIT
jgi:hypothetical protein